MLVRIFSWFLVLCLLSGCASNPIWSGNEADEVAQAARYHKQLLARVPEYKDEKLTEFVSKVGHKLAAVSDRPKLKWKFTVLDSPVENAFATMGGYVYITRGLLVYLRDERDLAAVLAHEIGHICRRDAIHAGRRAEVAGLTTLGLIVAAPALLLFPQVATAPMGMGLSAVNRSAESAADELGATYLKRAGYPPEAMQDSFDVVTSLETYKKSVGNIHENWWHRAFAQHPETMQRKERLAALNGPGQTNNNDSADPRFLGLLDGVEVGNSAVTGLPHDGKRYFPDEAIDVDIPSGWHAYGIRGLFRAPFSILLVSEKAGAMLIQKRPIDDLPENVCPAMDWTFLSISLRKWGPLRNGDIGTCTALGSRTDSDFYSKRTHWQRVGIVRLDRESYVTFTGYFTVQKNEDDKFKTEDQTFLTVAKSIAPVPADKAPDVQRLRIYRAQPGDTFEKLAITPTAKSVGSAAFLRAINVRSPDDNITSGELVKIVK